MHKSKSEVKTVINHDGDIWKWDCEMTMATSDDVGDSYHDNNDIW